MIVIFYGTSAELIKLLGVTRGVPRDQQLLICTAQQKAQIEQFHTQSGINPDIYLARGWRGRDVLNMLEMLGFMIKVHGNFIKHYQHIKRSYKKSNILNNNKTIAIVHGDTLTTVVGAYFGLLLGLRVSHIEAGMRSGKLFQPFPEEIDRKIVAKLARVHFAPNNIAVSNLHKEHARGDIIDTKYNTAKDAVELADKFTSDLLLRLKLPKHFGLISIHRTELLERKKELSDFLNVVNRYADKSHQIVFLDHATTKEKIKVYGLDDLLEKEGIARIPKLAFMDFIQVVKKADFILTDSGGLQQDAYFLGTPTLIHRSVTETNEGIGANIVLSELKLEILEDFLKNQTKKVKNKKIGDKTSPSKLIIEYLSNKGYLVSS